MTGRGSAAFPSRWQALRPLWPLAAFLGAALALWSLVDFAVWRIPGPPGFDVLVKDERGAVVAHVVAPKLLTPEVAPTPPPGGSLVARATFVAETDGVYVWQLGASSWSSLRVDGVPIYSVPGRVAPREQTLTAGLHDLEITMGRADPSGAIAFGVRPPWRPWRGALAGPGQVVAQPAAVTQQRLGTHAVAVLFALDLAPPLALGLALVVAALAIGAAGRARVRRYLATLSADAMGGRFLVALAFTAIALPLVWPLFQPGFFACGEEESYIVRLGEYQRAIAGGVPMGRWWPDPVLGRGYPFLCVYAPLLYILATPLLLCGMSAVATVKLLSGAVIVVGGIGVYRIVRRRASAAAALLSAALYMYAPYLDTDVYIRQDLAEALGFACFPLALDALERALDATPDRAASDIGWLALALAALGCSHNITAYFAVFFLGLWLILRVALRTTSRHGLMRALAGGGLGFLLCIFYGIPALFDANRIWIERVMTGYYNPAGHFLPVARFFTFDRVGQMRLFLGLPLCATVVAGLVAVALRRPAGQPLRVAPPTSRTMVVLAAAGVVFSFIISTKPLGPAFVRAVPLANHVQFPWRLLLFPSCLAPLCAPAVLDGFFRGARARWLAAGGVIVLLVAILAPVYGPPAPLVRSRLDIERFLRNLDIDYVTSMNEYLPITVRRTVPRFGDVLHLVGGNARIVDSGRSPGRYHATVDVSDSAIVEFNAHWFPGWTAELDGQPHAIGPRHDSFDSGGLIRVVAPPGQHTITLQFRRTPLRAVCDALSFLVLCFVVFLLVRGRRPTATRPSP